MRIIKASANTDNDFKIIAGEMYNIESSTFTYENGAQVAKPVRGYPQINTASINRIIRASEGYIYVSHYADMSVIESRLYQAITAMEVHFPPDHLKNYRTVIMNYHTNVKIAPAFSATAKVDRRNGKNIKRQFARHENVGLSKPATFTWYIMHIGRFTPDISSSDMEAAISRNVCSIFYDADDICKLRHNEVTLRYDMKCLKGWDNYTNCEVKLTTRGNPLSIELSPYWRDINVGLRNLRNISRTKVYAAKYEDIVLAPVKTREGGYSTEICSQCLSILHGENYVLYDHIGNVGGAPMGVPICVMCLHTSRKDERIEEDYRKVLRVVFPRTTESLIELEPDDVKREIYTEALKGMRIRQAVDDSFTMVEIGDEYIGFFSIDNYIYNRFSISNKKKVCVIRTRDLVE